MHKDIETLFKAEGLDAFAVIPFSACRVTRPYLYEKKKLSPQSVITFLIPYYTVCPENFSAYAAPKDYHLYIRELAERLSLRLETLFRGYDFLMFTDHSPIDERHAAVLGGLGVFGKNGLLLSEKYGSYQFIGEILTDAPAELFGDYTLYPMRSCEGCGACQAACPTGILRGQGEECLSAITQKKGVLTEEEKAWMRKQNTAWGCDACQKVCPYNIRAKKAGSIYTPIPFFKEDVITRFDKEMLSSLSEEDFAARAFSWRGRAVAERNAEVLEEI